MDRQTRAESIKSAGVDNLPSCLRSGKGSQGHCKALPCLGNECYAALLWYVCSRTLSNACANSR